LERSFDLGNGRRIRLIEGDITRIPVDAMANAANSGLAGGGGVDGAIHRAAGPALMRELDELRPHMGRVPAGQAVATGAGNLPARYVFHAVGPVYRDGLTGEPEALTSCYRVCLWMADERGCKSISFPSISTGVYGYPMEQAARIAIREVRAFLLERAKCVEEVVLVQFGAPAYAIYERLLTTKEAAAGD
jgi:O-acetyl-ADP-ribose deacetylase